MKSLYPLYLFLMGLLIGCGTDKSNLQEPMPSLKTAYQEYFKIGAALNADLVMGKDSASMQIVKEQFNTATPENILKWERVHPQPERYRFEKPDAFVVLGEKLGLKLIGHTLVWHNQTPAWVFENESGKPVDPETLKARMKNHIMKVVGRYKGKIKGWDVVNEAIDEQGNYRETNWYKIMGPDFIKLAFQWAHEADPEAELYYNDYNMWYKGKRQTVVKLAKELQAANIPIHGVGMQGHWGLDYPPLDQLQESIEEFAAAGLKVMITELDLNILPAPQKKTGADINEKYVIDEKLDPYKNGLPDSMQTALANRYAELFKVFIKYHKSVDRVTFWGVHDGVSWLNDWPVRGRTSYPLLFGRDYQPKPAFNKVIGLVKENNNSAK